MKISTRVNHILGVIIDRPVPVYLPVSVARPNQSVPFSFRLSHCELPDKLENAIRINLLFSAFRALDVYAGSSAACAFLPINCA